MPHHTEKHGAARDRDAHASRRQRPVLVYDGDCAFCNKCAFHILMKGSIIAASEGDAHAAQRGKSMARLLIEQHR